jgi:hypothetical protein
MTAPPREQNAWFIVLIRTYVNRPLRHGYFHSPRLTCDATPQWCSIGVHSGAMLPPTLQQITVFSAGLSSAAPQPEAGRALIAFLSSAQAASVMIKTGLDPKVK